MSSFTLEPFQVDIAIRCLPMYTLQNIDYKPPKVFQCNINSFTKQTYVSAHRDIAQGLYIACMILVFRFFIWSLE